MGHQCHAIQSSENIMEEGSIRIHEPVEREEYFELLFFRHHIAVALKVKTHQGKRTPMVKHIKLSQSTFHHGRKRVLMVPSFPEELLTVNGCWGRGRDVLPWCSC